MWLTFFTCDFNFMSFYTAHWTIINETYLSHVQRLINWIGTFLIDLFRSNFKWWSLNKKKGRSDKRSSASHLLSGYSEVHPYAMISSAYIFTQSLGAYYKDLKYNLEIGQDLDAPELISPASGDWQLTTTFYRPTWQERLDSRHCASITRTKASYMRSIPDTNGTSLMQIENFKQSISMWGWSMRVFRDESIHPGVKRMFP